MDPVIRIIIVDDHEIFRGGLRMVINKLGYARVVGEAGDGLEFLKLIEDVETDLVLMDIEMPNMNGIEATKAAMERKPELKIIALTMFKEDAYIQSMMEAGVKGFLIKNISKEVLDRALQAVYNGKTYYSEELWDYFTKAVSKEEKPQEEINITPRELEVLELLAEGLSNKEIADRMFVSERTIVGHKSNLMAKTNCKNTVALLAYAIRNKLIEI
ncbi:MAG: response regulator transcription factor [Bacteroidales bacterium]|jgi:DNA-binding NarL/FixJ family response regulator|nr:response regulator transcription factor [Bacteroidales bacterium]HOI32996.1 response regulator transcription factor [Bacteroidales bacterium]